MNRVEEYVRREIWSLQFTMADQGYTPARLARMHTLEDVLMVIESGSDASPEPETVSV